MAGVTDENAVTPGVAVRTLILRQSDSNDRKTT